MVTEDGSSTGFGSWALGSSLALCQIITPQWLPTGGGEHYFAMFGDFWGASLWDGSSGLCRTKAGMMLNVLHRTGLALRQKIIWPQIPVVPKSEKGCLASVPSPIKEEGCEQIP